MKIRFPLYAQTFTFLILHLLLLLGVFLIFFNRQFGPGWDALLHSPLGDRVESIAWDIGRQIRGRPVEEWNEVLDDSAKIYNVKFYIFDAQGKELAGAPSLGARVCSSAASASYPSSREFEFVTVKQRRAKPIREYRPRANGQNQPGDSSLLANQAPPHTRGRFIIHTKDPDCFWIGVRVPLHDGANFSRSHTDSDGAGSQSHGSASRSSMTVLVVSNNIWQSRIFFDFAVVLSVVGGVLAFSILLWCPFIFRITRELSSLNAATKKFATGKFDIALKGNDWDEIGSLSTSVSSMSTRLKTFVTGQKRFLGDIAHELCSPIARLQVVTEMLADSATPSQERYVADIRFEVEEMKALIDELLSFSKAEFTSSEPQLESVQLNSLIESVVNKVSADAEVVTELPSDLIVLGDRKLIERALSNVVSNAVRYAGKDGPIKLKGQRQGEEVSLVCSDCGQACRLIH